METDVSMSFHVVQILLSLVVAGIVGTVGWGVKQSMGRVMDKINSVQAELAEHKDSCERISKDRMDQRIVVVESEAKYARKFSHWVAESIFTMAAKLNIDLPHRPDSNGT